MRLVQLNGGEAGRLIYLKDFQTFGRDIGNAVILTDAFASREQCAITVRANQAHLSPKPGSAPVLVNGVMTQGQVLVNGDVLQLGQTQFRFEAAQAPAASAADPTRAFQPGTLPVQQPENMGIAPFTGQPQYIPPVQPTATSSGTPPFLWVALGLLLACPLMCVAFMSFAILPYVVTLVGLIVLAWGLIDKNNLALQGRFPTSFVQTKIFGGAFLLLFGGMWSIWWIQNHIDDSRYKRVDNEPTYSRPEGSGPGYDRPYKLSEDIQSPPRGN